jgi:hypothetical protein
MEGVKSTPQTREEEAVVRAAELLSLVTAVSDVASFGRLRSSLRVYYNQCEEWIGKVEPVMRMAQDRVRPDAEKRGLLPLAAELRSEVLPMVREFIDRGLAAGIWQIGRPLGR